MGGTDGMKTVWKVEIPWLSQPLSDAYTNKRAAYRRAFDAVYYFIIWLQKNHHKEVQERDDFVNMCRCYHNGVRVVQTIHEKDLDVFLTQLNHYLAILFRTDSKCRVIEFSSTD
jgi:hypothetical protein